MSDDLFPRASEILPGDGTALAPDEQEELSRLAMDASRALMALRHRIAGASYARGEVFSAVLIVDEYVWQIEGVMMTAYLREHPEAAPVPRPERSGWLRMLTGVLGRRQP